MIWTLLRTPRTHSITMSEKVKDPLELSQDIEEGKGIVQNEPVPVPQPTIRDPNAPVRLPDMSVNVISVTCKPK